eukprot:NODE_2656_length_1125_cov_46.314629_g2534_i0.p1 GENE.NODE_2656_length_1125_cov_46.314629_g2534_i0~~NODE_2656_length_1125_cov_46.314629_g2534_i0.p1  ORF type:complete len:348 (-),score=99.31 NODE_2656_length_1125_cov_46.314629_g2534_i0:80-1078(-)
MKVFNFIFLTLVVQASCCTTKICDETGHCECAPSVPNQATPSNVTQPGVIDINIDKCFTNYCRNPTLRNQLVDLCRKRGYDNCNGLRYKATYVRDSRTGRPAYGIESDFKIDLQRARTSYSYSDLKQLKWNNSLKAPQVQIFSKVFTKQAMFGWDTIEKYSISSSISATVTVGVPATTQAAITSTISAGMDLTHTQKASTTVSQSWAVTQTINIPAQTCAKACAIEKSGATSAPYTITGRIKNLYRFDNAQFAGQCCYVRPDGGDDCGWMGPMEGNVGWATFFAAGEATGCPNIKSRNQDTAEFEVHGMFKGSFGFDINVATVECEDKCIAQ